MAKPKEKASQLSAAFLEKCGKEKDRLRKKLAKQLQTDMERMLQEDIHTDLEFHFKAGTSVGHKLVLKSRARGLWDNLCEGNSVNDCDRFQLRRVDKALFDSYLFQVYGSEHADIASEELMVAIEGRADPNLQQAGPESCDNTDELFDPHYENSAEAKLPRADRISLDSLETDSERISARGGIPAVREGNEESRGDHPVAENGDPVSDGACAVVTPVEAFDLCVFQGAYSLDMIPSAHFAAGHDILATDASSLFVLPNGQEINNNDANNNGVDANQLVGNQNLQQLPSPRIVNLQPQVVDLVSHAVSAPLSAPALLLPDVQSQDGGCYHASGAHATLPDLIKTSCCTALPHQTCSRLAEDLLRAFLQEIECDCTVSVEGQDFKCHRCILAARSTYFTAMLGGAWVESDADRIRLEGVSATAVEQALLYIYGGVLDLTDTCNIAELILLSDMYGLEGLKDVISLNIRMKKCHFFHKPCCGCIPGVVEALSLAELYRLEELEERCTKWINKNLAKIWPTKTFALLPEATLQKCCQSAVKDLNTETVLDVIMECDKLSTSLPRLKWTEPVLTLITRLMDSAMEFTSQHFTGVIGSERFIALGKSMAWSMTLLDTIFSSVIKSLPVDHICKTYLAINKLVERTKDPECSWTEDFQSFVVTLLENCEGYIKLYVHQVVHTADWELMSKDIQQNLLEVASYVCIGTNRGRIPPKLTSMSKRPRPSPIPRSSSATKSHASTSSSTKPHASTSKPKVQPTSSTKLEKSISNASLQRQFQKRLASERVPKGDATGACGGGNGVVTSRSAKSRPKLVSQGPGTKQKSSAKCKILPRDSDKSVDDTRPRSASLANPEHAEALVRNRAFQDGSDVTGAGTMVGKAEQDCLSPKSDTFVAVRRRRGSTGDIPGIMIGVSRSRSEELHLSNRGDNSVLQLVPIFETKFTLPNQLPQSYTEDF